MNYKECSLDKVIQVKEGNNIEDIIDVLDEFNQLKDIKKIEKAKEFLKSKFKIENSVANMRISNNAYISIIENDKLFSINLKYNNKNIIYSFAKTEKK